MKTIDDLYILLLNLLLGFIFSALYNIIIRKEYKIIIIIDIFISIIFSIIYIDIYNYYMIDFMPIHFLFFTISLYLSSHFFKKLFHKIGCVIHNALRTLFKLILYISKPTIIFIIIKTIKDSNEARKKLFELY